MLDIPENNNNCKICTVKWYSDYTQLCPLMATINIHLQAICLGLKPNHPLAIYCIKYTKTYIFIHNKHIQLI